MRLLQITALSLALGLTVLAVDPPKLTDSMKADIKLMQERVPSPEREGATVAPLKAVAAANRVFSTLPLVGLTKDQVVSLIGEPRETTAPTATTPGKMLYVFDTGPAGRQFMVALDSKGVVTGVTSQHYD
jgi:hypothetical protein